MSAKLILPWRFSVVPSASLTLTSITSLLGQESFFSATARSTRSFSFSEMLNCTQIGSICEIVVSSVWYLHGERRPRITPCAARHAGDRRHDPGVAEIEPRFAELRLGGLGGGGRELAVGDGVVVFLLADGLALGERLQPRGFALRLRELGLRASQVGLGAGGLRFGRLGIDHEERLPGLDRGAFLEEPLFEDAAHPGPDFDLLGAQRLPDVLERHGDRRRRDRVDGHIGRREPAVEAGAGRLALAAGGEQQRGGKDGRRSGGDSGTGGQRGSWVNSGSKGA